MSQSNNRKNRDITACIYPRLSRDDGLDGDSNSIDTQKKLLTKIARDKGYTNILTFIDDGITGTTFDRPGFNAMMEELKKGYIGAVFVKDLSRLGRNHLEAGKLTEEFFPDNDIRLVAVSDGYDSAEGEDDLIPIRHLFNEWYARDISRKQRIRYKVKGNAGEPLSAPPYGYTKDPDNPKFWIVDREAAEVVKRIYDLSMSGFGTEQIADMLTKEYILTPVYYWQGKGVNRPSKPHDREPYFWQSTTVLKILTMREYVGDVVNFKTYSKSFKNTKRIPNDPENMLIFPDVHEPIVERVIWEKIQEKRGKVRKRKTKEGEKHMFSGLLICADCGNNLWFHFNQGNPDIKYFNCSGYNTRKGECPTTHYIRADFLEKVILQEIRRLTKFASRHEDKFAELIMGYTQYADVAQLERKQKELAKLRVRDKDLDRLFNRMYEDNVSGRIDDERFNRMTSQYTEEQQELSIRIKALEDELEKHDSKAMTKEVFMSTVRQYTRAKKLNERMLNELIERIEVHQSEKIDGIHVQKLTIHYNCVGAIEIPEVIELPDISMQTRRGVTVSYAPLQMAI